MRHSGLNSGDESDDGETTNAVANVGVGGIVYSGNNILVRIGWAMGVALLRSRAYCLCMVGRLRQHWDHNISKHQSFATRLVMSTARCPRLVAIHSNIFIYL
jgi:hypothetical protein